MSTAELPSGASPARVLHVVSATNRGGAETLLMMLYRNIDRAALQFDFVSHRPEPCDYDAEIAALGGRVFPLPSLGQGGPLRYLAALRSLIRDHGPYAAVHAHTDYQGGVVALAARQVGVGRRVCHSHNTGWEHVGGVAATLRLRALRLLLLCHATALCACSEEAGRFLFGNRPCALLHNGIELAPYAELDGVDRDRLRAGLEIPPGALLLGHVGRFYEQKNHAFLLRVLRALADDGVDFVALLVGDGPLRAEIERLAVVLGLGDRVRFPGVRADIPALMHAFDLLLLPSRYEGFGIVMLEAQAAATPCLAADTVPRATDMGLGLARYLSLDRPPAEWAAAIREMTARRDAVPPARARAALAARGYDVRAIVPQLLHLYGLAPGSEPQ